MAHLLVSQLRFARSEFVRGLEGVTEEEAEVRYLPMNCISWMVGHLANQELRYWVVLGLGENPYPELNDLVGFGRPACTPSLREMWVIWRDVTARANAYLDRLTPEIMLTHNTYRGKPVPESVGTMLMRNIYHYWYHLGEAAAVRQQLGHTNLPDFVGDMTLAGFRLD
jgi:hypothetical protein